MMIHTLTITVEIEADSPEQAESILRDLLADSFEVDSRVEDFSVWGVG